ncbi:hypothetical protein [Spiroplasma sp. ald]|uniref:hypothetical protein n=1 Tax=Spiroplasma sp. ald TaxID=2490849 RepID=UPI0037DC6DE1
MEGDEIIKTLTWPKILMFIGAAWIIIIGILFAAGVPTKTSIYGWDTSWPVLLLLGILYILVPLSVKPGFWSLLWALAITGLAVIFLVGFFVKADYQLPWTYLGAIPNLFIGVGALRWIFVHE